MKHMTDFGRRTGDMVAPRAGAWIETKVNRRRGNMDKSSPPARGRGLKRPRQGFMILRLRSPPARGRGLKHRARRPRSIFDNVAPRAGAWIETCQVFSRR